RRRHTRFSRDWSSDVCSSDLAFNAVVVEAESSGRLMFYGQGAGGAPTASAVMGDLVMAARNRVQGGRGPRESKYAQLEIAPMSRSEERRVGEAGRWRWGAGES